MAVWVEFSADYDHRPHPNEVIAYRKGDRFLVPQNVADAAVTAGKGSVIHAPEDLKTTKSGGVKKADSSPVTASNAQEK